MTARAPPSRIAVIPPSGTAAGGAACAPAKWAPAAMERAASAWAINPAQMIKQKTKCFEPRTAGMARKQASGQINYFASLSSSVAGVSYSREAV
jgi:hypothetical protein